MSVNTVRISKFLSLVLRHEPARAHVVLDEAGWVSVEELLAGCARAGREISRAELDQVVAENDKKRFAFSADWQRIRANQGHSVEVELAYAPITPPELLYHGTATRFLTSINATGLEKRDRHHVHLSADHAVALNVGGRHGSPVALQIAAGDMSRAGHLFYQSANGVWLTDNVPMCFITIPSKT